MWLSNQRATRHRFDRQRVPVHAIDAMGHYFADRFADALRRRLVLAGTIRASSLPNRRAAASRKCPEPQAMSQTFVDRITRSFCWRVEAACQPFFQYWFDRVLDQRGDQLRRRVV